MDDRTLQETRRDDLSSAPGDARVEPVLYVALEGERPLGGGMRIGLSQLDEVQIGRGAERRFRVTARSGHLELPDPRMSRTHARLVRDKASWVFEDLGSTNGSFHDSARVTKVTLGGGARLTLGATALLLDPAARVPEGSAALADSTNMHSRPRGTATLTPGVEADLPRLIRVAASKLSVLLLGASGVGKEILARAVHQVSGRGGPFVAINCAALAPTLVESQLFGHVKGAFSGALKDEVGLVRASSGGTLFLDEIGELPASAQATLLRVLQEREVLPVGATKPVPVDLRVIAATLKPIDDCADFRQDLYARIAAFVHRIPPLSERRGDIGLLVADLLPRIAPERAARIRFAPDLTTALVSHAWPLNVRELEHVLSVALVTSTADVLKLADLGDALKPARGAAARSTGSATTIETPASTQPRAVTSVPPSALSEEEAALRESLVAALTSTRGNVSEIARDMGKTRMQIHRWMKRFGIDPESFRD